MLAGIALAIVCVWCGNIEAKAGNTMLTAETMALNSSATGTVNYRTQEYYKLTLSQNTQIQMELHTAAADDKTYVRIYDSNAEEIYYSGAYFYTTDDNNWGVQRKQ